MAKISMIGLDFAKNVFQIHGIDAAGKVVLRRQLRRAQMEKFFTQLPPTMVGMEACGGAHHWARTFQKLGHEVRIMPPAYVKPYVKRNKNDGRPDERNPGESAHATTGVGSAMGKADSRYRQIGKADHSWRRDRRSGPSADGEAARN